MSATRYHFNLNEQGRMAYTPGVDWEVDPSKIEVLDYRRVDKIMALKMPGRNVWAARGERRYEPAAIYLFRVESVKPDERDGTTQIVAEQITYFPLRGGHSQRAVDLLMGEAAL